MKVPSRGKLDQMGNGSAVMSQTAKMKSQNSQSVKV